MFTGIIQTTAKIKKAERRGSSLVLTIAKPKGLQLKLGDSIATNGVCLTVDQVEQDEYKTELMAETLTKTTFGKQIPGVVNLERPVKANGFLDGHIVQGHVDCVGKVTEIIPKGNSKIFKVSFNKKYAQCVVEKGSIAIEGVSLTVVACGPSWLSVALVKYTLKNTNLDAKQAGDLVNLEFDIIAKYVAKYTEL